MMRGIAILFAACVSLPWGGMAAWAQSVNPRPPLRIRRRSELRQNSATSMRCRRAWRHEKHGWIYLHVEGEPRAWLPARLPPGRGDPKRTGKCQAF